MSFRPLQKIEAIMGGGRIFGTGPFFARLRYIHSYIKDVTIGKHHFRVVSAVIPHFQDTNHGLMYSPLYSFHDFTFTFSLSTLQYVVGESCFYAVIYKDIQVEPWE